jgi:protein gp37
VSDASAIEWTDATWNVTRGCKKISPGCKHCYAERFAERFRDVPGHAYEQGFDPRFVPGQLDLPLRWAKPRRIFVDSMSDLFQDDVSDGQIAAVFGVMALCPQHTFQVLTKRADRMRQWFEWADRSRATMAERHRPEHALPELPPNVVRLPVRGAPRPPMPTSAYLVGHLKHWATGINLALVDRRLERRMGEPILATWPLPNVWLGVSVEDQEYAERRIPHLLTTPAAVRFVSYEPALGPVNFRRLRGGPGSSVFMDAMAPPTFPTWPRQALDWIIMGGESGPGARPMDPAWARSVRDQCAGAGVAFFFKQWGGVLKKRSGRELDGRTHDAMPR